MLHGQGIVSSRNKLAEIKKTLASNAEVEVLDGGSNLEQILSALSNSSLFSEQRAVILENSPQDLSLESLDNPNLTLVLWFNNELDQRKKLFKELKSLDAQILFFPESKEVSVFPFLDLLANSNPNVYLELEKLKKSGFDIFYLITMVFYLLRGLIYLPPSSPSFVKQKNANLRKKFSDEKIKNLYRQVLELDFKLKSGLIEKSQAEVLLIRQFSNLARD